MKQTYVKMNNNNKHLSLGNLCRLIKELALNKSFAGQSEVFYALFEDDTISDSAINNYCIGYREIGKDFKNIYLQYQKEYSNNPQILNNIICNIISILEGNFKTRKFEQENILLKKLCIALYNLAKNDSNASDNFCKEIHNCIKENNFQAAFSQILFFIILEKKQPIYTESINKEILESILNSTYISINELEKFLKLQLQDGVNYFYGIKKLAKEGNPCACHELGEMEYKGEMVGYPRYIKAFEYLKIAADKNHPRACWLIAQMFLTGKLKQDFSTAWEYLKRAESLGSVAAINTIGIFYLNGYVPGHPKNEKKAIEYFEKAAKFDYAYSYNNLGKLYESKNNNEKALEYYLMSATLEESWACNKVGQIYLNNKDYKKAFEYFNLALNVPSAYLEYWAMYNLAKHFYLFGCHQINLEANKEVAIKFFEESSNKIPNSLEELIYIFIDKYKTNPKEEILNTINNYIEKLSLSPYYKNCKQKIEQKLIELKKSKPLKIEIIND